MCAHGQKFLSGRKVIAPAVESLSSGARACAHVSQVLPTRKGVRCARQCSQVSFRAHHARAHVRKLCPGRTVREPVVASFKTCLNGRLRDAPSLARLVVRASWRSIARAGRVIASSAVNVLQRSSATSIRVHGRCALYAREKARTLIACLEPSYHSVP